MVTARRHLPPAALTLALLAVLPGAPAEAAMPAEPARPAHALTVTSQGAGTSVVDRAPQRTLAGPHTQIYSPWEVAVRRGRTYVKSGGLSADRTQSTRDRILVYGKGARGDARPERVIKGPKVGDWRARGITVDRRGRIITTTSLPGPGGRQDVIAVFGRKAHGNVAPRRVITDEYFLPIVARAGDGGPFFSGPLAVTRDGTIYANTDAPGSEYDGIAVFAPGASGGAAPIRWIRGPHTGLRNPTSIRLDRAGNIWVTSLGSRLLRFPAGSDADAAPDRRIELGDPAASDESAAPRSPLLCGVDSAGNVYAVSRPGRSGRTTQVSVFGPDADGYAPALVRLAGPRTKLNTSSGCALDAQRRVTVSLHFKSTVQTYAPLVPKR